MRVLEVRPNTTFCSQLGHILGLRDSQSGLTPTFLDISYYHIPLHDKVGLIRWFHSIIFSSSLRMFSPNPHDFFVRKLQNVYYILKHILALYHKEAANLAFFPVNHHSDNPFLYPKCQSPPRGLFFHPPLFIIPRPRKKINHLANDRRKELP